MDSTTEEGGGGGSSGEGEHDSFAADADAATEQGGGSAVQVRYEQTSQRAPYLVILLDLHLALQLPLS
jgi:hypothetical protein